MEHVVLVANAPLAWSERLARLVAGADFVVAADGGANHLARIGVRPAAVVGDLDSLRPSVRAWLGDDRIVHRPDQDSTDLHKALAWIFDERGARRVTVLGATGGRLDHAVENLGVLARFAARGDLEFVDAFARWVAVVGRLEAPAEVGQGVSLVPLGACPRVWTRGLAWALDGEPLAPGVRSGVSNRAVAPTVEVTAEGGPLLVAMGERGAGW